MRNIYNNIMDLRPDNSSFHFSRIADTAGLTEGYGNHSRLNSARRISCPLEELLYSIYDFTVKQDKKAAKEKFTYLNDEFSLVKDKIPQETLLLYLVVKLKYFILINDKKLYIPTFEQINELPTSLNLSIEYIQYKTLGIFYYRTDNFVESTLALAHALNLLKELPFISEEDKAELYYQTALTKLKTSDTFDSIHYAEAALTIYQGLYYNKRSAECHIILGINYNFSKRFDLAENHYVSAKNIGESIQDRYLESMALNNLGKIKSNLKESEEAIFYYLESLKLRKDEERSVFSILGLVEEYYFLDQKEFSKEWAEQGLCLAKRLCLKEYILHFTAHLYLIEESDKLEDYVLNQVLPYFKRAGNERYTNKYTEMLAHYYYDNNQYKLASDFYNDCLQNIKAKLAY
ncbi:tetratricopeptide repeat protein [Sutcliffiella horikoshii]|uniref:tetratricopeptide repeat protein n=1 Tax=Sutcliffiella horikoshii TaxID=79883 RepID=UPI00203D28AE|nr:tetratricopeptide repeat protein [Sutcliffiella horikoshii]MCM3616071.1 tetratricopeptide repeat protein [Sutcliffiella horikoshii]